MKTVSIVPWKTESSLYFIPLVWTGKQIKMMSSPTRFYSDQTQSRLNTARYQIFLSASLVADKFRENKKPRVYKVSSQPAFSFKEMLKGTCDFQESLLGCRSSFGLARFG